MTINSFFNKNCSVKAIEIVASVGITFYFAGAVMDYLFDQFEEVATRTFDLKKYKIEVIEYDGFGTLNFESGDVNSLTIDAQNHVLNNLIIKIRGNTLILGLNKSLSTNSFVKYTLSSPNAIKTVIRNSKIADDEPDDGANYGIYLGLDILKA